MSKKDYIKRPEWMDKMENDVHNIILTAIRKKYGLSENDKVPDYTFMSIEHNTDQKSVTFNVRVNRDIPELISVNYHI